ncbi:MAG: polyphenol oxidase [Rhodospirillaceae bacterium]|nr:polyphenol oxidase [Rhodospirillaceae bacterium]
MTHEHHASAENLLQSNGIRHLFLSRAGGVSEGIYAGLNCGLGSDDSRPHVVENRSRAARSLGIDDDKLRTLYQVHSATVIDAETMDPSDPPRADALVCSEPGIAIGVLAADCAPVLFAAPAARIVAAAHAGWRGALDGVIEATVAAMTARGADRADITAAVGPCIGPQSYEVGPEFPAPFLTRDPAHARFFTPRSGSDRLLFNLPGYVGSLLAKAGVDSHTTTGHDTYGDENFFSYRRSCHRAEPDYGRNLSLIMLDTTN